VFQKEQSVITKHISYVFKEGELDEKSNVQILHISGPADGFAICPTGSASLKQSRAGRDLCLACTTFNL
jgi:hypothetical protein